MSIVVQIIRSQPGNGDWQKTICVDNVYFKPWVNVCVIVQNNNHFFFMSLFLLFEEMQNAVYLDKQR